LKTSFWLSLQFVAGSEPSSVLPHPSLADISTLCSETSEHKFAVDSLLKERDAKKLASDTDEDQMEGTNEEESKTGGEDTDNGMNKENEKKLDLEKEESSELSCAACKVSGGSFPELWERCIAKQKVNVFGAARHFSCDMCDVHLSEESWLHNHLNGEKHKWVAGRIEVGLPVQWEPQEIQVVTRSTFNPFTFCYEAFPEWHCNTCKVSFSPADKYRKHLGSLFHLRKCAGEDVTWVEGGGFRF